MSLHRMGALMGAYTVVGLGFASVILLSQHFLNYPVPQPSPLELTIPEATPTQTPSPEPAANPDENLDVVLDLLHSDYLNPVNDRALFASSFKYLKEYLKTQKVDIKDFPELPDKLKERPELTQAWKSMLDRVQIKTKGKYDRQKLVYLALKTMLLALKDPYCSVLEPREFRVFEEHMTGGNFSGIGVMIELDRENQDRVTVSQPIEDGPAAKAGILAGDVLVKIDGADTKGWDIEKAANHIRGKEGSTVKLTLFRPKEKRELEISVVRSLIHVRSCQSKMAAPDVGYINVMVFAEETGKEFEEEVAKVKAKGAKKLILDLRNNGGGYINAAIDICSHFVPEGQRVVSVVNPRLGRSDDHNSLGKEEIRWPCVVLVNRFSASASEITAGCLRDHKRARLIGETTFGKASVQQVEKLIDGGAFKYTVAHYLTPSGRDIHRKGIKADIQVTVNEHDKADKVLDKGLETLKTQSANP